MTQYSLTGVVVVDFVHLLASFEWFIKMCIDAFLGTTCSRRSHNRSNVGLRNN